MQGTKLGHLLGWLWTSSSARVATFRRHRADLAQHALDGAGITAIDCQRRWPQPGVSCPPTTTLRADPLLLAAMGLGLRYSALAYLGDAARYLSNPQNVMVREQIRADGVDLLRALHNQGDYERIIVVGHSLGSVIAYDIVGYLWHEYHDQLIN